MRPLQIGRRTIASDHPAFIVAEMSANHNHSLDRAKRIIEAAAKAGADAVKIQTYTPDTMTIDSDKPQFRVTTENIWSGKTLYQLYREANTPWEWHPGLQQVAADEGIELFSTPFDNSAVDFLSDLAMPAYKIASFELVDHGLVAHVASRGKAVILSTGMASMTEISEAIEVIKNNGDPPLALLHCVSAYPAKVEEMNLATIPHLASTFDVLTGLSDHTLNDTSAVLAIGLGARIIEKHFTLSRADEGPDSFFSLEPSEFSRLVGAIREAEQAVGRPSYTRTSAEVLNECFRRSLFVVQDVRAGEEFTTANVRSIRPGGGLPPKFLPLVMGRRARVDIERGTPLSWNHF